MISASGQRGHHYHPIKPPCLPAVFLEGLEIAEVVGLSRNRASEIVGNTNFSKIDTLLAQGRDMDYIASHHHSDLALARAESCLIGRPYPCLASQSRKAHLYRADFEPTPLLYEKSHFLVASHTLAELYAVLANLPLKPRV